MLRLSLVCLIVCWSTLIATAQNVLFRVNDLPAYVPADVLPPAETEAFLTQLKKGDLGNAEAQANKGEAVGDFLLGWAAEHPPQGRRDGLKAEKHYRAGAEKGHVPCKVNLAVLLMRSSAANPEASDLLAGALAEDARIAGFFYGISLLSSSGTAGLEDAATAWKRAGEAGSTIAWRHLGMLREGVLGFAEQRDAKAAAEAYEKAIASGDSEAAVRLGVCFLNEAATLQKTVEDAERLFEQARVSRQPEARYLLAQVREQSLPGLAADVALAAEIYTTNASELRHAPSMVRLGQMADHAGRSEKAGEWYQQAADLGHAPAFHFLAQRNADKPQAFALFLRAAIGDYALSTVRVAECYRLGIGTPPDPYAAGVWFTRAIEAGDTDAMISLAEMMLAGEGVPFDKTLLDQLCQRALNAGNPRAALLLGMLSERGMSREKNLSQALAYYRWAAERKSAAAEAAVKRLGSVLSDANREAAEKFYLEQFPVLSP